MAKKSDVQSEETVEMEQPGKDTMVDSKGKKKSKDNKTDLKLMEENEKLKAEAGALKETAQRIQAEFDNYRRRSVGDSEQRQSKAVAQTISAVIPALDSMDEAIKVYSNDDTKAELKEGIEKIRKQLADSLFAIGVKEMECEGGEFDPSFHEAVMMQDSQVGESGIVLTVFRKGYMFKDTVIRHAQVIVSK